MRDTDYATYAREAMTQVADAVRYASTFPKANMVKALDVLSRHEHVVMTGLGKSGLIAQRAAATWRSVGLRAVFIHPVEAMHGDSGLIRSDSVMVAVSQSGETREVVRFVGHVDLVAISVTAGGWHSKLGKLSNALLDSTVLHGVDPTGQVPMATCAVQAALLDALVVAWMWKHGIVSGDFLQNHPGGTIGGQDDTRE